jgi:aryl-alcohol dehydrogenase-like predicted oxidoreductase
LQDNARRHDNERHGTSKLRAFIGSRDKRWTVGYVCARAFALRPLEVAVLVVARAARVEGELSGRNWRASMESRFLGRTGERLSAIGFGCMGLVGWYGARNDAESGATLLEAIDRGMNHVDTAASYQNGENEKFVGSLIRDRRSSVFLATKYGITRTPEGVLKIDNRPESIRACCEASLQRLGIERIDLFYLHRIDPSVPIEESMGALKELIGAGKIRHVGLSECSVQTLRRACAVHPVAAVQSEYSLWSREPENGMLAACRELSVGFVAYSPLGRGFLAGNFRTLRDLPADDHRRQVPRFQEGRIEHNAAIADAVNELARRKGCTAAQLALAWVLAQGVLVIPGMKTRAHLQENLGALDLTLTRAEQKQINTEVEAITVRGERHAPAMMKVLDG